MHISHNHVQLFLSLFKGRTDVFAVRWEKDGKSGYMPAYDLDWNEFNRHKAKGGTFQSFQNKKYQALTSTKILEHLTGKQTIGVYPLLADNTSWFIAADFDEKNWLQDCLNFMKVCESHELPVYLERSRSGNGGHVWMFFEENYPAVKSRDIFKKLLNEAQLSVQSKGSFDRLFPNQDSHSGVGVGNLIALPLQGSSIQNSNSCFIDLSGNIISDQWKFLESIQRVSINKLNELYPSLLTTEFSLELQNLSGLHIRINNQIVLNRNGVPALLLKFIKAELQFVNQEFLIKKKFKRSTYNTEASFKLYSETISELMLPRGFAGKLIRFCKENSIAFTLNDQREKFPEVEYKSRIKLYSNQEKAIEAIEKKDLGVIVAPPGSGKTVIALEIIARKKQPSLIIVHRQQLLEQWQERTESFLGIPKQDIGQISGNSKYIGKQITIAMIQSLDAMELKPKFGVVIVDECHHIPAKTFRTAIENIQSYYLYGLTATPTRKYNDESLIYTYIGDIIIHLEKSEDAKDIQENPVIIIRDTDFYLPFNNSTDNTELLLTALINDTLRNQMIVEDVSREVRNGKRVLILTERKSHIQILSQYLKVDFDLVCISGEDSKRERDTKLRQIHSEDFQILISTGQFLGEGTDIPELDSLFLVFPFSFEGKLIQYIGRLQRGDNKIFVFDYRDKRVDYLDKQFKQRNTYYNTLREIAPIEDGSEHLLFLGKSEAWFNHENNSLQLSQLDLPEWIAGFTDGTCWRVKVIKYNTKSRSMLVEILDYNVDPGTSIDNTNAIHNIDKIVFKTIDPKQLELCAFKKQDKSDTFSESRKESFEFTVPFDEIRFDYGHVHFHKHIIQLGKTLKVRVDNDFIRPEFEIIRDYFKKLLRIKTILVTAEIGYRNNQIVSVMGTSKEIDRINTSVIDAVKFDYLNHTIKTGKGTFPSILTSEDFDTEKLFSSEAEILDSILENSQPKHYRQLKYLSKRHCYKIAKLRFILEPFSFLFLLEGEMNYHLVWETLDTEEATYIWHISKEENLREELSRIDIQISQALKEGKFLFLDSKPERFSRIYHDYSAVDKGFVKWRDGLEKFPH